MGKRRRKKKTKEGVIPKEASLKAISKTSSQESKGSLITAHKNLSLLITSLKPSVINTFLKQKIISSKNFLKGVWDEVSPRRGKVSWPERRTVLGSTLVVIICVSLVAAFIAIVDGLAGLIFNILVGRR
jgi:preprotein translocase SecE subunit